MEKMVEYFTVSLEKRDYEADVEHWNALSDSTKTEPMVKLKAKRNSVSNSKGNS
jgi:hypothetical protein